MKNTKPTFKRLVLATLIEFQIFYFSILVLTIYLYITSPFHSSIVLIEIAKIGGILLVNTFAFLFIAEFAIWNVEYKKSKNNNSNVGDSSHLERDKVIGKIKNFFRYYPDKAKRPTFKGILIGMTYDFGWVFILTIGLIFYFFKLSGDPFIDSENIKIYSILPAIILIKIFLFETCIWWSIYLITKFQKPKGVNINKKNGK